MTDGTDNATSKAAEDASNLPKAEDSPQSKYSFANPQSFAVQYHPPAPLGTNYGGSMMPPHPMFAGNQFPVIDTMMSAPGQAAEINDYKIWSIFNCLCCCWPFGLVALLLSSVIMDKKKNAQVESAKRLSIATAVWNGITTLCGIGLNVFIILYYTKMRV